jgi:hypothetical protein
MRKSLIKNNSVIAMSNAKASGAENVNISDTSHTIKSSTKNKNVVKFPSELIQRMQYVLKKTSENGDDFLRITFVTKALSYDNYERPYKQLLAVKNEGKENTRTIIATDGRRLHMAEISYLLPAGYYNVQVKRDAIIFQEEKMDDDFYYPNYEKVYPDEKQIKKVCELDLYETSLTKNIKKNGILSKQFAKLIRTAERTINIRFLDDLAKMSWSLYIMQDSQNTSALLFKVEGDKKLSALIMPINDED